MPLQATSGTASYDGFGGGVVAEPNYIESCFSTYLYTGNDTVQTITNGIDLSTKGGAVFIKSRNLTSPTVVYDTNRGINKALCTNLTNAENVGTLGTNQDLNSFNTNGFAVNLFTNAGGGFGINNSAHNLASWTFRKQPKFFDVVTWTGSNDSGTSIGQGIVPHNLGSAPGCVIIKNVTQGATNWIVYHRSLSGGYRMLLNTTDAQTNSGSAAYFSKYVNGVGWTQTDPDANNIYVGYNFQTNGVGDTIVAYVFAHDAGGFGLSGTDNVISCGSFTDTSTGGVVDLGYEPQFVLVKSVDVAGSWFMLDTMRGWINDSASGSSGQDKYLLANSSGAEGNYQMGEPTATGFRFKDNASGTYIYIAIRRGPMKVPTSGTSVFSPVARAGTSATATVTAGFPVDMTIIQDRTQNSFAAPFDRLRGATNRLFTPLTAAEASEPTTLTSFAVQDGFTLGTDLGAGFVNTSGDNYINWNFRRAPSFFDEVCYTGTGVARTVNHNLGVAPEMLIVKYRSSTGPWYVYVPSLGNTYLALNGTNAITSAPSFLWNSTAPTSSVFSLGDFFTVNEATGTYVAYLFATCAGVSKVGSYTGTGATQTVNCGFAAGARWVLIKRTDSTGDWYVWDTSRGMVSGTDPSLALNSTAAEVNANSIYTTTGGFQIVSTAAGINASGGTYIYLAIA